MYKVWMNRFTQVWNGYCKFKLSVTLLQVIEILELVSWLLIFCNFVNLLVFRNTDLNSDPIDSTFSLTTNVFGQIKTVDLIPNGSQTPVTESNKHSYVQLFLNHRFKSGIEVQFLSVQKGFNEVVPGELLKGWNGEDLEQVLRGRDHISVQEWKKWTKCKVCKLF